MDIIDELENIGMGPACPQCGKDTDWLPCSQCFGNGGRDGEDLMEEDPLWYSVDDFETCDLCEGQGGWWRCWDCKKCFGKKDFPVEPARNPTPAPVCPAGGQHDWPTKTGEIYTGVCQKCGQGR